MTTSKGSLIADLFEAMPHDPDDILVRASYRRFIEETVAQYAFLTADLGIHVEPWDGAGEPYRNSGEMMDDIRRDNHLYFLPTGTAWGNSHSYHSDHPMLTPTPVEAGGGNLPVNDVFRVVHDVFAHAKEGHQFGPSGEESAWWEHLGLYSHLARPALTSETRGQTCWTFYGRHLRHPSGALIRRGEPGWTPVPDRSFAEQKAGLLPDEVSGVRLDADPDTGTVRATPLPGWHADSCLALTAAASRNGKVAGAAATRKVAGAGATRNGKVAGAAATRSEAALDLAYRNTTYRVALPDGAIDIRVGRACVLLDALLSQCDAESWAFLTAWNPGSRRLPLRQNRERHRRLQHRLQDLGVRLFPGLGIGDDGSWVPEESVLAVDLEPDMARRIGAEFQQNAIVVGRAGGAADLVWCRAGAPYR